MSDLIDRYLSALDKDSRFHILKKMKDEGSSFPIELAEDILCMNLSTEEKISVLDLTNTQDLLLFEHFLTQGSRYWDQNLSAFALRKWINSTDHLLWYRLLSSLKLGHISQRFKYTILDLSPYMPANELLGEIISSEGLEEFSEAFHALLIKRCIQWSKFDDRIRNIVFSNIESVKSNIWPDHKALFVSIAWISRFESEYMEKILYDKTIQETVKDHFRLFMKDPPKDKSEEILSICNSCHGEEFWKNLEIVWLPFWSRAGLSIDLVKNLLEKTIANKDTYLGDNDKLWEFYAGINLDMLLQAVLGLKEGIDFSSSLEILKGLIPFPIEERLLVAARKHLEKVESPHDFLSTIPMRFRYALHGESVKKSGSIGERISLLIDEEQKFISQRYPVDTKFYDFRARFSQANAGMVMESKQRKEFFDLAYREEEMTSKKDNDNFWSLLSHNWLAPSKDDLPKLSTLARQEKSLFHICYIRTLGRFHGVDEAALKLLDYIRTTKPSELYELIHALGGIGTPRAIQELLSSITRPNMTTALQLEICEILKGRNLETLQAELRSAIDDLKLKTEENSDLIEVRDCLANLLSIENNKKAAAAEENRSRNSTGSAELDSDLKVRIPHYGHLSSEVRRALRTAQFFYSQVESGQTMHAIDLSPVIDMQYKALELIFRESFEEVCFKIISQGILQRKLDLIGYSRPIPKAMDEFESYIGSLPIIQDIPYFSKFKLRKMLRAICQYRPGRRFTLDGIKAFSLFFLCFGRKACRYNFVDIIPLSFANDEDLFNFCKILHVFQDFRNRAAHEGFRPEARNDMEGIWQDTAHIVDIVFQIKGPLSNAVSFNQTSPN